MCITVFSHSIITGKCGTVPGYEDPIWPTKEETDSSYHRVLGNLLKKVKKGKACVMVATHNEGTVHFALEK